MRRFVPLALVWTLLALALGVAAASAAPDASPPDGPDLSLMTLDTGDFARARVAAEGPLDAQGAVAVYGREFDAGSRVGRTALLAVTNYVELLKTESEARAYLATLRLSLGSARGRADFARAFKASFSKGSGIKVRSAAVSRPTTLGIGVDSVRWGVTLKTRVGRLHIAFALVRIDRAVGTITLVARPGKIVALGDVKRLGVAQRNRFRTGFTITRGQVVLDGTAMQGSTLTANHTGRFDGGPSEFAYQWSRCAPGGACTPIPGATGPTYTIGAEDARHWMKVTVTGRNTVSSFTAEAGTVLVP
jgi:hypothetical protein